MHARAALSALAGLIALASSAVAGPSSMDPPQIGAVAPAFGLPPIHSKGSDTLIEKVELDDLCGMRSGETQFVVVAFTDEQRVASDLSVLTALERKLGRAGVHVLLVSTAKDQQPVRDQVGRVKLGFAVLDDSSQVVARRYGAAAPFSVLVDHECKVLGMSNRPLAEDQARLTKTLQTLLSGESAELPE